MESLSGKEAYDSLIDDVLSKRATVRAMALLKNKDYTRKGLEDKLRDGYYRYVYRLCIRVCNQVWIY